MGLKSPKVPCIVVTWSWARQGRGGAVSSTASLLVCVASLVTQGLHWAESSAVAVLTESVILSVNLFCVSVADGTTEPGCEQRRHAEETKELVSEDL